MPDWCANTLVIIGDKKELKKFRKKLFSVPKDEFICSGNVAEKLREDYIKANENNLLSDLNFYAEIQLIDIKEFVKKRTFYDFDKKGNVVKKGDDGFLNKFYPVPSELGENISYERIDSLHEKYGASNAYDWRVNNWGTNRDVSIDEVIDLGEDGNVEINIHFDSAWSPPTNWLKKVYLDYPKLHFTLIYEEGANEFRGETFACAKDGLFEDNTYDFYGSCGDCEAYYESDGTCGCVDEHGNNLIWGEEKNENIEEEA
jgi:hypothetical protein